MARRLRVPPTKSKLLELRRHVAFLEAGYELLERKRELLTRLVYERLDQYRELRSKTRATLEDAYRWLGVTHLRTGSRALEQIVLGLPPAQARTFSRLTREAMRSRPASRAMARA